LSLLDESIAANSPCGDWEPYKEEKCFKIFDKAGLQSYEDAEKTCQQQENSSSLISNRFQDEQEFISNFLKTNKIVDNVWIGLKYDGKKYKWVDDSNLGFTNWAQGSPKSKTDHCVQLQSDETSFGKWSDVLCNKKNLVVCQKMQTWSLSRLQKTLLDARKELRDSLEDARNHIKNIERNPIPIGFIYVQLPKEKSPNEIWPWMIWNDVSSAYAGVFFRVPGGEAASFGQVQLDNVPYITSVQRTHCGECFEQISIPRSGGWSANIYSAEKDSDRTGNNYNNGLRYYMNGGEVRPRNMAIRIWKRTG
jgi:hypothetical protein